jgi:hypothetical protein
VVKIVSIIEAFVACPPNSAKAGNFTKPDRHCSLCSRLAIPFCETEIDMLTHADADRAMNLVRSQYSAHYPKGLDSMSATEVFVFADIGPFTAAFTKTFNSCFKAANGMLQPAAEYVPYVNGFVASNEANFLRRIYIKKDPTLSWGTCVHEYLHYLTDKRFYPQFYSIGGANPDIVEGFTEYLTRMADSSLYTDRKNYQTQFEKTRSWVNSAPGNLDLLLRTMFEGAPSPLAALV